MNPARHPTCAVVLPIQIRSREDAENLHAVASALTAAAMDVWVVEQEPAAGGTEHLPLPASVQRVSFASNRAVIERSKLVNLVASKVRADRIWVHDPNLLLPFSEIARRLVDSDAVAIQPFTSGQRLSRQDTRVFHATGTLPDARSTTAVPLGKASYIIEREVFLALGGLSEAFVGRADEGLELVRRLKRFFEEIEHYPFSGVELWAPRAADDGPGHCDNRELQGRLARLIDDDVGCYLSSRLDSSLSVDLDGLQRLSRKRRQLAAFRVTSATPPLPVPRRLSGSIWGITALFNPAGYRSKRDNFEAFRARLHSDGLPLLVAELAFGDAPFEIAEDGAEKVVRLRGADVLWQKERLLNVAVASLPRDCDKVVWLDADILFERRDWVRATAALLDDHVVVQPFSRSARLMPNEHSIAIDDLDIGSGEHELLHGMAYGVAAKGHACLGRYLLHGHCGYAWAARRDLLERHGLYDANVLGNGDLNIAHAMFGGAKYLRTERLSCAARLHLERWAEAFHEDVRGSVAYVDGTVFHLWHGQKSDRRYVDRLQVLVDQAYDPDLDLRHDGGAYRWARDKPALQLVCRDYFSQRREDG